MDFTGYARVKIVLNILAQMARVEYQVTVGGENDKLQCVFLGSKMISS